MQLQGQRGLNIYLMVNQGIGYKTKTKGSPVGLPL
jgi:hypothetical protein